MSTTTSHPLLSRPPDQTLGWLNRQPMTAADFLNAVQTVADHLPDAEFAVNLCQQRLHFLIGFCAALVRGQCNLLLPNHRQASIRESRRRVGEHQSYVLHDQSDRQQDQGDQGVNLAPLVQNSGAGNTGGWSIPNIALTQPCVATFTSGTTGEPASVEKTWRTIVDSTRINRAPYLGSESQIWQLLATVPAQHMYGLESSIFMPLMAPVAIHSGKPLLPADVAAALQEMGPPRLLISTPAHLKALVSAKQRYPQVGRIVSATAPLDQDLAQAAAQAFGAEITEIYGCSEAGSLARRNPVTDTTWQLFEGFDSTVNDQGQTLLTAAHLAAPVTLSDRLSWRTPREFALTGRSDDEVNVAGKRGSVAALTQTLLAVPGVIDAAVFQVPGATRLAGLAVAPGVSSQELRQAMRERVDDVLVPRPLLLVKELPRNATGKLPRQALLDLYEQQR